MRVFSFTVVNFEGDNIPSKLLSNVTKEKLFSFFDTNATRDLFASPWTKEFREETIESLMPGNTVIISNLKLKTKAYVQCSEAESECACTNCKCNESNS